jgi:hypothetical protein
VNSSAAGRCRAITSSHLGYRSSLSVPVPVPILNLVDTVVNLVVVAINLVAVWDNPVICDL